MGGQQWEDWQPFSVENYAKAVFGIGCIRDYGDPAQGVNKPSGASALSENDSLAGPRIQASITSHAVARCGHARRALVALRASGCMPRTERGDQFSLQSKWLRIGW